MSDNEFKVSWTYVPQYNVSWPTHLIPLYVLGQVVMVPEYVYLTDHIDKYHYGVIKEMALEYVGKCNMPPTVSQFDPLDYVIVYQVDLLETRTGITIAQSLLSPATDIAKELYGE